MNYVTVNFIGKEYSVPKDLLVYLDLLTFTNNTKMEIGKRFYQLLRNNEAVGCIYDEQIRPEIDRQTGRFVAKLMEAGIYDKTVTDFLTGNKGFELISSVNKAAFSKTKELLIQELDEYKIGVEDALYKRDSSITGMGFSILSNSFVNHAIYAAMEASTLNKQEAAANKVYQQEIDALHDNIRGKYNSAQKKYIGTVYIPNMEAAIAAFAYELLDTYISCMIKSGKLDKSILKHINIDRSNDLLKNLDLSPNKKAILHKAFETCPYNLQVYEKTLFHGLMDYATYQTAQYFRQGKNILLSLVADLGEVEYPGKFKVNYMAAEKMAEFTQGDVVSVLQAKTKDYVASVIKAYGDAVRVLDNRQQAAKIMSELSETAILSGSSASQGKANAYINGIVSQSVWAELTEKCGYTDLLNKIKAQVPGAESATTKHDVDLLLEEKLYPLLEEARQIRKNEITQKREDEAKQKAAEVEKARRTAKRNKKIKKICFIAAVVVIVIAIASTIITKVNNAKAYQEMAGEFCVYRVINDDGEERDEFNWWLSIGGDGTMKMTSWSYAIDNCETNNYSGTLKRKADFRKFEEYRIEDYCTDASEYEKAQYCYEFHIADEWVEFDGYIVCWQYQNGKIVDIYCDNYRYSFVETGDNYSFYMWEKEIDSDGLSENVKDILASIVNSKHENEPDATDVEYDKYLTWYNVEFASSFLGKELNADGSLSMGAGDYEAMSNDMYLFDIPGRFSCSWSSVDADPIVVDILDWVTKKSIDDFNKIRNPLIERYGNDYRVQHYEDAAGDAYIWENVEMYECVICWQNRDGTVDIRWTYSTLKASNNNNSELDDNLKADIDKMKEYASYINSAESNVLRDFPSFEDDGDTYYQCEDQVFEITGLYKFEYFEGQISSVRFTWVPADWRADEEYVVECLEKCFGDYTSRTELLDDEWLCYSWEYATDDNFYVYYYIAEDEGEIVLRVI